MQVFFIFFVLDSRYTEKLLNLFGKASLTLLTSLGDQKKLDIEEPI